MWILGLEGLKKGQLKNGQSKYTIGCRIVRYTFNQSSVKAHDTMARVLPRLPCLNFEHWPD